MANYTHGEIEKKWQKYWDEHSTYAVDIDPEKPKYYILDMFPYPSGAGLHVGHPLGYIASDIFARYKKLKGFNVLHPMGFDSFGLPAEQYAIQTGQHPAITTKKNIETYIGQLKNIGFGYDWSREIRTSDPAYYKWTQWIFMQLFNSWYNLESNKAEDIETLKSKFEAGGSAAAKAVCAEDLPEFTAEEWKAMSEEEQYETTLAYRMTYLSESVVNFCPALGMVLSNDEVKDGVSERGGYPVIQKKMRQWVMRITAYCDRLIDGLDGVDWSESLKEQQRNWIGRSKGASVKFALAENVELDGKAVDHVEVFTTRIDTIYGVSFMVLAPENELVPLITTADRKEAVEHYIAETAKKSELDRMSNVKTVSGTFTGAYCVHPLTGEKVPIWIADYVLAGYGTGAVMAVPSGDQRDYDFAKHFDLPILPISDAQQNLDEAADASKEGRYINSEMINGMAYDEAVDTLIRYVEDKKIGKGKVNYRLRDAVFARQRYWGEPVPVYFKENTKGEALPYLIDESDLPLELPKIDEYKPTETGEPPLGRAKGWKYKGQYEYELSTMPGWAGSSWYWYRYMDPKNEKAFASKEALAYWKDVDLYLGGTEHATGHLLYSRFWNKFLKDKGFVQEEEFAKKLINQGMIQGRSSFVYRIKNADEITFVSYGLKDQYDTAKLHVDVNLVDNDVLDVQAFISSRNDIGENPKFILEDGKYVCGSEVEKMSKSKFNVVNPDDLVEKYGADTLRLYEMFLGPLTEAKPWDTKGIEGTSRFLKKLWRLFFDNQGESIVSAEKASKEELKALHKAIKKVGEDIENFSFNTSVSTFMICVNELTDLKCHKKEILEQLLIILSPYAPHIAEELWAQIGNAEGTITVQRFPAFNAEYLKEDSFEYPIQIGGKVRLKLSFAADASKEEIEKGVLENETVQKWMEGKPLRKIIVVPKRIVNVVV
ncbi:leucine--tRNA ligase [Marinilongibacter aquaticus]|uniref:leucine--tRNA ligase n=1 Tax=Marinilongibacter aquaticus TaxID=2975157 RepID=UPI0021BD7886|nr:leucine--tRNA ligase [Marinilongibacter aquaticus]UBM59689.1 leucine--tRNA ligase [Marinilongibacter aquaticus]